MHFPGNSVSKSFHERFIIRPKFRGTKRSSLRCEEGRVVLEEKDSVFCKRKCEKPKWVERFEKQNLNFLYFVESKSEQYEVREREVGGNVCCGFGQ